MRRSIAFALALFAVIEIPGASALDRIADVQDCSSMGCSVSQTVRNGMSPEPLNMTLTASRAGYAKEAFETCTKWVRQNFTKDVIESCEWFIANRQGTARELAMAHFYLGHALSYGPRDKQAIEEWIAAARIDSTYTEPELAAGKWFAERKDVKASLLAFDRAMGVDPKDWRVYSGKAWAWFWVGGEAEALSYAEKGAELGKDKREAQYVYGRMLEVNGRLDEAADRYELAAKLYRPDEDRKPDVGRDEDSLVALSRVRENERQV